MSKNFRWGILGAGRIAEKFCTAIIATEGAEVFAVASRDASNAKAFAERFNAARYYDNYEDLMNDPDVDIIYIATPHAFHYNQTIACLQHKKAVLCEKPMSLGFERTKRMIDTAAEHNVFLMEGMWTACMPFIETIKSIIQSGKIGTPQYVAANFGFDAPVEVEGRLYNKKLGGGAMMDVGVYPLFFATLFLGVPSVVKAVSKLAATGIDEYTSIILQYPQGATAQLLSSIVFHTDIEAVITGTKGSIKIKNPWFKATEFIVRLNDGTSEDFNIPHVSNGFEHEVREVMQCLEKGLLQSDKVPHSLSLLVSSITDEILKQSGVVYE